MLSIRDNFVQTVKGGKPDRFVKQYEYVELVSDPILYYCSDTCFPGEITTNLWGASFHWPDGAPGPFPMHDDEHLLIKDITEWKKVVHAPDPTSFTDEQWAPFLEKIEKADRNEKFVGPIIGNGIFEKLHTFMGMKETLINFYTEPECMQELIDYIADWEIQCAREQVKRYHPDIVFHHDDWGSQTKLFMSPAMFEEFLLPAYKRIYGFWKEHGVEYIVHHSDSYAADLVPAMIEMGIDVWQGAVEENDIPALLRKYGEELSIQAGLDNGKFDFENWSKDEVFAQLEKVIEETDGGKYLLPCCTMGAPECTYPGLYEYIDEAIDQLSLKYFATR